MMKKQLCFVLSLFLILTMVLPLSVSAEKLWQEDYYRIADLSEELTNDEIISLDRKYVEFMRQAGMDISLAIIPDSRLRGEDPYTFAAEYFLDSNFGYGENRDGLSCLYMYDTQVLVIARMGNTAQRLSDSRLEHYEKFLPTLTEKYGMYGIAYGILAQVNRDFLPSPTAEPEITPSPAVRPSDNGDKVVPPDLEGQILPYWWPQDYRKHQQFQDPSACRVVDDADLFSDSTEKQMLQRIGEISAEYGKDIVIYTDVSTYGMHESNCAADFYDFNGYGIGPEGEGFLLFICMDPNNRCGYTVATGPECRALLSEQNLNRLDDVLYAGLGKGHYEAAVLEWIENIAGLYRCGYALAPDWYPANGIVPDGYRDPDASYVDDTAEILTADEIWTLENLVYELRDRYEINVYLHTYRDLLGQYQEQYAPFYAACKGYDPNGLLIMLKANDSNTSFTPYTYVLGDAVDRVSIKNSDRIANHISMKSDPMDMLETSLYLTEVLLTKGRVPRTTLYWSAIAVLSVLVGGVYGTISLRKAKATVRKPELHAMAFDYVVHNKTFVRLLSKKFLYSDVHREYVSPRTESTSYSSSSSSSSSRSSYRPSYTSHSGTTHTGGGRKF